MPVVIAPTGLAGSNWPDGEIEGARAAEAFGIPFTLSTMSICPLEAVSAAVNKPFWFQLYVMKDRSFVKQLIMRARACKVSVLVVTVDLNVPAQRHADVKNGLTVPPRLTFKTASDMVWRMPCV
jgi:L-lactate dehydrogenase (cytochrome)